MKLLLLSLAPCYLGRPSGTSDSFSFGNSNDLSDPVMNGGDNVEWEDTYSDDDMYDMDEGDDDDDKEYDDEEDYTSGGLYRMDSFLFDDCPTCPFNDYDYGDAEDFDWDGEYYDGEYYYTEED